MQIASDRRRSAKQDVTRLRREVEELKGQLAVCEADIRERADRASLQSSAHAEFVASLQQKVVSSGNLVRDLQRQLEYERQECSRARATAREAAVRSAARINRLKRELAESNCLADELQRDVVELQLAAQASGCSSAPRSSNVSPLI